MSEIRVSPTEPEPTHHMSLSDGVTTLGVYLSDGSGQKNHRAIQRSVRQATPLKTAQGALKYSDRELPFESIAQDDWSGGRGSEDFEENTSRYFDGQRINAEHPGQLILGGLETYTTGHRSVSQVMPGDLTWTALYSGTAYIARSFVPSPGFTASRIEIPLRYVGAPGMFKVELCANNAGVPGTVLQSGAVLYTTIGDTLSVLRQFVIVDQALTGGQTYWIKVYQSTGAPDAANHWEVGSNTSNGNNTKKSADGSSWSDAVYALYYRVTDYQVPFTALFFEYKGQLYFATRPDDGAAGKLYMNGFRGLADSNSADKSYLNDATQNFTGQPTGIVAQIYDGAGVQEQQNWREVAGVNPASLLVSPPWNIEHIAAGDDATQYNILGCNTWVLQQTGGRPFLDVAVTGEMAWLASGEGRASYYPIYKLREYSDRQSWTKYWANEPLIQASFLQAIPHPTLGHILWLARNNDTDENVTLTRAPAPRDHNQALVVAQPYHSATTDGFMKKLTISPLASDSLNRVNGSLGTTDGSGHTATYPFGPGGSGVSWVEFIGTWGVVSNRAKASALVASKGMAGFSLAENDVIIRAKVYRSAANAGVFVRRADDNNYVSAFHTGTNVRLVKRVSGVDTTLIDQAVTYVDGAEIELKANLTTFTVKYNGVQVDTPQIIGDAGVQSGAGAGLITSDIANTFDDVYVYAVPIVVTSTGLNSAKIDVPGSFGTGLIACDSVNNEDWRRYTKLLMSIKSTKALAAGELQLFIDDSTLCGSPIVTVNFPALAPNVTYGFRPHHTQTVDIEFDLSTVGSADTIFSVGLNLTVDPTSDFSLYVAFRYLEPDVEIIPLGDGANPVTGLERYGDPETLWVMKQGGISEVTNDIPVDIPLREMAAVKSHYNGRAHLVHDVYLYFSMLHSLERYFRQNVDDVGPNKGTGLPLNRQGAIVHMVGYPGRIYAALDGGYNNYSSVLCHDGVGWHEVYRAPRVGARIRRLHIQPIPGDAPDRLWISQDADILWMPLPSNNFNPYYDGQYVYTYEAALTTPWFYAGLRDIVKKFKSVKLFTEGLDTFTWVDLYYRTDGNTAWTLIATPFNTSPVQEIDLSPTHNVTGRRIQFRLVLHTSYQNKTPKIVSMVLELLERIPVKWQYTFEFNLADGLLELGERDPEDTSIRVENIMATLDTWLSNQTTLTMRTIFSPYDNKLVMLAPEGYTTRPLRVIPDEQTEQHSAQATVIEI